jgi:hypothetical protein
VWIHEEITWGWMRDDSLICPFGIKPDDVISKIHGILPHTSAETGRISPLASTSLLLLIASLIHSTVERARARTH